METSVSSCLTARETLIDYVLEIRKRGIPVPRCSRTELFRASINESQGNFPETIILFINMEGDSHIIKSSYSIPLLLRL